MKRIVILSKEVLIAMLYLNLNLHLNLNKRNAINSNYIN